MWLWTNRSWNLMSILNSIKNSSFIWGLVIEKGLNYCQFDLFCNKVPINADWLLELPPGFLWKIRTTVSDSKIVIFHPNLHCQTYSESWECQEFKNGNKLTIRASKITRMLCLLKNIFVWCGFFEKYSI